MRIITGWSGLAEAERGASVAMGNFDGVHRGHQAVIDTARRDDMPLGVVTFEPHPRAHFFPDRPPFRLMSRAARANRLAKIGVERLYELPFRAELASLTPQDFAGQVLAQGLGVGHVVVGADFCFGAGRAGTAEQLRALGAVLGFEVTIAPLVGGPEGAVSSSAIRTALAEGRPRDAAQMLGHWHRIDGTVEHGEKRGRELGFPTANLSLDGLHIPRYGVYAALVDVLDGPHAGSFRGAASLGVRPQFVAEVPNLETYLFDFSGDLYGAQLSVGLVEFLRPEQRFDGVAALIAQMGHDCDAARRVLAAL